MSQIYGRLAVQKKLVPALCPCDQTKLITSSNDRMKVLGFSDNWLIQKNEDILLVDVLDNDVSWCEETAIDYDLPASFPFPSGLPVRMIQKFKGTVMQIPFKTAFSEGTFIIIIDSDVRSTLTNMKI